MNRSLENKLRIKSSNLEAHLSVLKLDVQREAGAINALVAQRKQEEAELRLVERDIVGSIIHLEDAKKEADSIIRHANTVESQTMKRAMILESNELKLAEDREEFEQEKDREVNHLKEVSGDIFGQIKILDIELDELDSEFRDKELEYNRQIDSFNVEIQSLENSRDGVLAELDRADGVLSEAQKSILSSEKEKEVLSIEIAKTLESKENIFENLEDREQKVSDRERDAGVIIRRMEKKFKQLFPGKEMNI